MKTSNNKGFTLVELAIVLVIIGLLISGILAAQSMINTTRVQAFTRQISQYDAAVANFQDKYKALPGDNLKTYTTARTGIAVADDGMVTPSATTTYDSEMANFWPNLSLSGLKSEENPITGFSATLSYNNNFPYNAPNAPKSRLGNQAGIIVIGADDPAIFSTAGVGSVVNMYIIADCTPMTTATAACKNGINGSDALAIDSKLDDGFGTTGQVVAYTANTSVDNVEDFADIYGATEDDYVMGTTINNTTGDIVVIRLGTQTGDTK